MWVSAPRDHSRVSNINFDIWISFCGGCLYKYLMKNILRTAEFLSTWGFNRMYWPGLYMTEVPGWVSAPQAHSRVSNINFDIWIFFCGGGSLKISHTKYFKDGKVLAHLGFQSKVLSKLLTHWNAWVGSAPQTHSRVSNINFDIWFFFGGGSL